MSPCFLIIEPPSVEIPQDFSLIGCGFRSNISTYKSTCIFPTTMSKRGVCLYFKMDFCGASRKNRTNVIVTLLPANGFY